MATVKVDSVKDIALQEIEAAISRVANLANLPAEKLQELRDFAAEQAKNLSLVQPQNLPTKSLEVAASVALEAANMAVELGNEMDNAAQVALTDSIRVGLSIVARVLAAGASG